jgi:predicted nucleic acid-binding protein
VNHALRYCLDTDMCIYLLNGHPRVKIRVAEAGVTALGVAVSHGLTMVTNNTEHFVRIPDLPLENWLETPQQSS